MKRLRYSVFTRRLRKNANFPWLHPKHVSYRYFSYRIISKMASWSILKVFPETMLIIHFNLQCVPESLSNCIYLYLCGTIRRKSVNIWSPSYNKTPWPAPHQAVVRSDKNSLTNVVNCERCVMLGLLQCREWYGPINGHRSSQPWELKVVSGNFR